MVFGKENTRVTGFLFCDVIVHDEGLKESQLSYFFSANPSPLIFMSVFVGQFVQSYLFAVIL